MQNEAQYLAAATATARRLADAPGTGAGLPAMLTSVTVSAGGGSSLIPARGTNPAAVHAWRAALTPAARKELTARYPAQIGWLDGLPATARNTANRAVLAADQQTPQRQLDTRRTHEIPANQVAAIRAKLNAIKALNQALGLGPAFKADHVYLLGFDLNGNGHAIVAFGNPGTAQNVVTYVPGVGARLAGAHGDAVRAEHNPLIDFPVAAVQLYDGYKADVSGGWGHSHFGVNPASLDFGGHDFQVPPGTPPDTSNIINGILGVPVPFSIPAHSQYWDVGSQSLKNLAHIVDGKYGSVTIAQPPMPPPGAPAPSPAP